MPGYARSEVDAMERARRVVKQQKTVDQRPITLAEKIKERSNNLDDQVNMMLRVSRGQTVLLGAEYNPADGSRIAGTGEVYQPTWDEAQNAIKWLADRSYGKPTQTMAVDGEGGAVGWMLVSAARVPLTEPPEVLELEATVEEVPLLPESAPVSVEVESE